MGPRAQSMQRSPRWPEALPPPAIEHCAMTSRRNRHAEGQNDQGKTPTSPSALERRRQEAVARYLADDPIEVICWEMGCSTSWVSTWKKRYQATEPDGFQEHSRRPRTTPTQTPEAVERALVRLRDRFSPDESGTVSAQMIRDPLRRHQVESLPSRRTISRILKRHPRR